MTRPDWCSADVWEAATTVACDIAVGEFFETDTAAVDIARAILAERERCAKVAEFYREIAEKHHMFPAFGLNTQANTARDIRDAIRAGTPCP